MQKKTIKLQRKLEGDQAPLQIGTQRWDDAASSAATEPVISGASRSDAAVEPAF